MSSEELTGAAIDNCHMVVLPKLMYQYKETSFHNNDLVQLELAQRLLQDLSTSDEKRLRTPSFTKSDTNLADTTVETADATNRMVDIYAKFIM